MFPNLEVEHLIKQGSNHAPLLTNYKEDSRVTKKYFRFHNFWVEHETFWEVVRRNWSGNFGPDPIFHVHNNLKKVNKALSKWSSDIYGDILKEIATLEEVAKVHELEFEQNPTNGNRKRLQKSTS